MKEVLATLDDYVIYRCSHSTAGNYCLCVPTNQVDKYHFFIGFADRDLGFLSKEEVVQEVRKVSDLIHSLNNNGVYILPDLPVEELEKAAKENDDRRYNDILNNKVQPIIAEVFRLIVESRGNNASLSQTVNMVKRNDRDKKFAGWLGMKLGNNFINEIDYEKMLEDVMKKEQDSNLGQEGIDATIDVATSDMKKDDSKKTFESGIAPIDRSYEQNEPARTQQKQNRLVRRRVKEHDTSPGFGNIKFIIAILMASLVIGISIGCWLIK